MREYPQDKNADIKTTEQDVISPSNEEIQKKTTTKQKLTEFGLIFCCILVGVLACITIASTLNGGNAIEKAMYKSCLEGNLNAPEKCAEFKPNNEESK
jgi:hypothetical protein